MTTNVEPPEPGEVPRETLLSLPRPWLRIGFPIFTVLSLMGYAVVIWYATTKTDENGPAGTAYLILSGFALSSGAALGLSIILTEVIRTTMVIADWLDRKYVEPLRRKRAEEARQREEEARQRLEAMRSASREEGRAEGHTEGLEQGREQGLEQGLEQGRAEANARWQEWNARRLTAEASGEPFDEPWPNPTQ